MQALLTLEKVTARYGDLLALHPSDIHVQAGEFVGVVGPNGAGKSTLMRAIMALHPSAGHIAFAGNSLDRLDTRGRAAAGLTLVPESRALFAGMTVAENLALGGYSAASAAVRAGRIEEALAVFPRLKERYTQLAGSLSGGEQQMLAIARALVAAPRLLLLDEPSLGLAPKLTEMILETLAALNKKGLSILMVEQKAPLALEIVDRMYVMAVGSVRAEIRAGDVSSYEDLAKLYFH